MPIKTYEELKNRIWFRGVQVLYGLTFFLFVSMAVASTFYLNPGDVKVVDLAHTTIICNYGNHKTFSANEAKMFFSPEELGKGNLSISDDKKNTLRAVCEISDAESARLLEDLFETSHAGRNNDQKALWEIEPRYKIKSGLSYLLYSLTLSAVILLVVFFIIRSMFYYIILGRFFPK